MAQVQESTVLTKCRRMKNSEAVDEELTASVTPPEPLILQAPLDDKMLNTKELSMKATAAHLTTSVKELLLLDPP